ncbi:MAG: AtpZ/AtpI family protein [Nitrospinae bacterium]|nr:AtpZ/AtpI family protein [Nitrospinota bacterium]
MNGGAFTIAFATPTKRYEREALSLRVMDLSGHLGILKNHTDFVTVLAPSLGIYRTVGNKEVFLAINGGVLTVGNAFRHDPGVLEKKHRGRKNGEGGMNGRGEKKFHETVEESVRALRASKAGKSSFWRYATRMMGVGWLVALPVIGGAYLGRYMDRRFSSSISWTLTLIILGMAAGIYNVWHFIYGRGRE